MKKVFDIKAFANNMNPGELSLFLEAIVMLGTLFGFEKLQGMTKEEIEALKPQLNAGMQKFVFEDAYFVDLDKHENYVKVYHLFEIFGRLFATAVVNGEETPEEQLEMIEMVGALAIAHYEEDEQVRACVESQEFDYEQRQKFFPMLGMIQMYEALQAKKGGE
jgi:hypothetical protein